MVSVKLYPIHPALASYVRMIWTLDLSFSGAPVDLKMTADCYPHLVIRCTDANDGLWLPGEGKVPLAALKGISLQSKTYKMSTDYTHIAVSFYPDGVKNIFRIDANETVSHVTNAEYVMPPHFVEKIITAASHNQRAEILNAALLGLLNQKSGKRDNRVSDFLFNHKEAYHKKLKAYNIGERQFERLFYSSVGVSPSLYKRLYRFEETLATIRNNTINSLTELAYHFGYADQAHFCREFKSFTGETPHTFLKNDRIHEDNGNVERPDGIGHLIGASL